MSALGLTQQTAQAVAAPSNLRMGTVKAVNARGIDVTVANGLISGAAHLPGYNPAVGDPVAMVLFQDSWLVLGRPIGPGTATDNASPGAALGQTLLDGCALKMSGTVLATSTGASATVPRYGVTYYHPPSHWVLIQAAYTWYCTVATDIAQVRVRETVSNTQLLQVEHPQQGTTSAFATQWALVPPTLGGQARSIGLEVQRFSGTGTSQIEDHATRRGLMLAYDLGSTAIIRTV